jgi:hypothetical protein
MQTWTFESELVLESLKSPQSDLVSKCLENKGWDFTNDDLVEQMVIAIIFSNSGDDLRV